MTEKEFDNSLQQVRVCVCFWKFDNNFNDITLEHEIEKLVYRIRNLKISVKVIFASKLFRGLQKFYEMKAKNILTNHIS